MAGGAELEELSHELEQRRRRHRGRREDARGRGARAGHRPQPRPGTVRDRCPELRLGSCPDSWGVWFADDPRQTPWQRFLDELAGVGYEWLELGPYGYLPTDPARLTDELGRRGLRGVRRHDARLQRAAPARRLRRDPRAQTRTVAAADRRARRQGRGLRAGARATATTTPAPTWSPAELDDDGWTHAGAQRPTSSAGRSPRSTGVRLQFHPHADSYVETQAQIERLLAETDPDFVNALPGHRAPGVRRRRTASS